MLGRLISIEGAEGAGKTTACHNLMEMFKDVNMMIVREPGSTKVGEKIRDILKSEEMPARAELMLFEAARSCIIDSVIKPALAKGTSVICDRFYDSTTAYQGAGRGIRRNDIEVLNEMATLGMKPDLTVLFDIAPSEGMKRKGGATDRIEAESMDFHERVRQGFLEIANREPVRVARIDASKPAAEVLD